MECAPTSALLCTSCDERVHAAAPLHDREAWSGTHFIPIPPTQSVYEYTLELTTIGWLTHY